MRRRQIVGGIIGAMFAGAWAPAGEKIVLVAGGGTGGDGAPAVTAKLVEPFGCEILPDGGMLVPEFTLGRIRKIDRQGTLHTLAGTGKPGYGGDGGPATQAQFDGIHNVVVGPEGTVYIADTWNHRIRKIDPRTGIVTSIAGVGVKGFGGDGGPAAAAYFSSPYCVALDPAGTRLFVVDLDNRRLRVIELPSGIVRTVAGNGQRGVPADGAIATEAPLVDPRAVTVDPQGNVYLLERSGHALRVIAPEGTIRTVAGTGMKGATGDGGPAREATMNGPKFLCMDAAGDVLIADTENHVIRKYAPKTGRIERIAGTGKRGAAGVPGPPRDAELDRPHGVSVDASGAIYIADSSNHRVLKIVRE